MLRSQLFQLISLTKYFLLALGIFLDKLVQAKIAELQ